MGRVESGVGCEPKDLKTLKSKQSTGVLSGSPQGQGWIEQLEVEECKEVRLHSCPDVSD